MLFKTEIIAKTPAMNCEYVGKECRIIPRSIRTVSEI